MRVYCAHGLIQISHDCLLILVFQKFPYLLGFFSLSLCLLILISSHNRVVTSYHCFPLLYVGTGKKKPCYNDDHM
jgi:hypothetical protein